MSPSIQTALHGMHKLTGRQEQHDKGQWLCTNYYITIMCVWFKNTQPHSNHQSTFAQCITLDHITVTKLSGAYSPHVLCPLPNSFTSSLFWSSHVLKVLKLFISVTNQLDTQNFSFTISLFHASTCFKHMCSKHVEAWNKLIVKQKFCASSWLITEVNILRCTVSRTSKKYEN
jgi:hypothetical protein